MTVALMLAGPASATHPTDLAPTSPELDVVGRFDVPIEGLTSDVWAHGNYAYLGSFHEPSCSFDTTGVRVVDISDPANPSLAAFIKAKPGTRNNDVKVEHIDTPSFSGEILVVTNEECGTPFNPRERSKGDPPVPGRGGIAIYDVSDPTKPKTLKSNFLTNGIHNTFIWQQGTNAYLIAVDDVAARDVVVVDITKPQAPKVIATTGGPDWPDSFSEIPAPSVFLHDAWVQENDGRYIAYLSYWDSGLVLLDVTDPANPVFLGDSTYPNPDVVSGLPPEGNGHVAAPTEDGQIAIFGDEDQNKRTPFLVTSEGQFNMGRALFGPDPIENFPAGDIVDTGGLGCTTSAIPPAPDDPDPQIALIQRGACFFSVKAFNAEQQGYDAYIVFNVDGDDGVINMSAGTDDPITIPGVFIGNSNGLALRAASNPQSLGVESVFDGEGFMRVLDVSDPSNIVQIGHFATEGVFARGEIPGDRTAHNVIVRDGLAYWSWYYEGMRVVDFSGCSAGGGFESCTPTEVAHYANENESTFWGVYLHDHPDGNTYILGSDRNGGLWIFDTP
jgi:hypothetical protein